MHSCPSFRDHLPHNPAGADKSEGLGERRRENEEDEKKEAEERSKRKEHPHGVKFSTSVGRSQSK